MVCPVDGRCSCSGDNEWANERGEDVFESQVQAVGSPFVEKYRAYLGSAPFKLRVDNRALAWLKTYSMDQSYIGRWIVRLDGYHMIIEHRTRDKHQNADSLSKKTEFYERLEEKQANQSEIKDGFSFLDKETYDKLPLTRWLDKSGHPIPGHPDLPVETAAEIKLLARGEPVPLDLLVRSNLVQQELTRLGINSMALLNRTLNVAPDVMGKLRDLLDREVDRHDREWMETMQRLTVTERTEKRPVSIRSRGVERDCRSIVNQLVTSMPKEVLLRTSFTEYGTLNQNQTTEEVRIRSKSSFTRRVHFTDAKEEYEPSPDCSSVDETMSGESDTFEPIKDDSSEESDTFEPVQDDLSGKRLTRPPRGRILSGESGSKRPKDRVLSGESRNISDNLEYDVGESVDSSGLSRFQITEVHQGGRFYRLSTGRAAHYENIKPHNASSEDWCIPADMQEGDYLIVDPACEVNERGTRDKNDGNEVVDDCDLPLDLELTERVEVDDETLPYAEEDWDCPEQTEIDKGIQPDFPLTMETRQSKRGKNQKKYNPYGEDFVVDRIVVSDVIDSLVGLDEVAMPEEIDLVNDMDQDWIDDRSEPEVEFEPKAEQTHEQELTNLRVLEWLHDLPTDPKETILTIQDVDRDGVKYISHDNTESNWVAPDGPLRVPQSNLDLLDFGRSTGTSMDIFVRVVGVGLTHTENLIIKKLKSARETGELETEGENAKKPPFGRIFESYFDLPNHYSNNIVITDSDFILTERTCAIAITADVSFKTALAADFKREYKNIEFLWKQKPGVGGMIALPPVASQIPGKYLCFLVTKATDRQHVDPKAWYGP